MGNDQCPVLPLWPEGQHRGWMTATGSGGADLVRCRLVYRTLPDRDSFADGVDPNNLDGDFLLFEVNLAIVEIIAQFLSHLGAVQDRGRAVLVALEAQQDESAALVLLRHPVRHVSEQSAAYHGQGGRCRQRSGRTKIWRRYRSLGERTANVQPHFAGRDINAGDLGFDLCAALQAGLPGLCERNEPVDPRVHSRGRLSWARLG